MTAAGTCNIRSHDYTSFLIFSISSLVYNHSSVDVTTRLDRLKTQNTSLIYLSIYLQVSICLYSNKQLIESSIKINNDGDGCEFTAVARFNSCWVFADDWIWDFRNHRCDSLLCCLLPQRQISLSVTLLTGMRLVMFYIPF